MSDGQCKSSTPDQIVATLREAGPTEALLATISQVGKQLGRAEQTFYRTRRQLGSVEDDEAIRPRLLEEGTPGSGGSSSRGRCWAP